MGDKVDEHDPYKKYLLPGWAAIKKEYINLNYKRTLFTNYLPEKMKQDLVGARNEEDQTKLEDGDHAAKEDIDAPPKKKARLKGRNKKRPAPGAVSIDGKTDSVVRAGGVKLCPSIINGTICSFGEKCRYEHNTEVAVQNKMPNLEGKCYTFQVRGKCDFGAMCRFSDSHYESVTGKNEVDEDRFKSYKATLNTLNRETSVLLKKKQYDFSKSYSALKNMGVKFRIMENVKCCKFLKETQSVDQPVADDTEIDSSNIEKAAYVEMVSEKKIDGSCCDDAVFPLRERGKRNIDFSGKIYVAPLTTVGNLPFRRICKQLGADVTCGEMALAANLLKGQQSEWALLKRHHSEDLFGVQICGAYPDQMTKCSQLIQEECDVDFIDINCGCPIDMVFNKGEGSGLLRNTDRLISMVKGISSVVDCPVTVKLRSGIQEGRNMAHTLIPKLKDAGVGLVSIHGRSRQQRFTRQADWDYIKICADAAHPMNIFGNGDVLSFEEYEEHLKMSGVNGIMLARGALIKPWLPTEIKERRYWDISSSERFSQLRDFSNYGLEHWGSDHRGVETTRRFMLEWMSFLHRYIPVGLLERLPQRINERPPYFTGRDDMETLLGSANCADWIKISEMLLGPVPDDFIFVPKHKANSYR